MGNNRRSISRSPGPAGTEEDGANVSAYERRRRQVIRAQRKHRERKAEYVKALEQELINLRNQNTQNIQEYEDEVHMLQGILISAGVSPPARRARVIQAPNSDFDPGNPSSFTISTLTLAGASPALHLHVPAWMAEKSYGAADGSSSSHLSPEPEAYASSSRSNRSDSTAGQLSPSPLDKFQGINFVLGLECPCMEHVDITRNQLGTHCHMASSSLLAYAPMDVFGPARWEVPGSSVDSLLERSNTVPVEGVVTPVQAWHRLRQHPLFPIINEAMLQQLGALLQDEAKCYGYGTVIDESIWDLAVQTMMMPPNATR